jgi:hypothetical protein
MDKRYREKYQVSLIGNAVRIGAVGAKQFCLEEKEKWTCSHCGGVISLHGRACSECGQQI